MNVENWGQFEGFIGGTDSVLVYVFGCVGPVVLRGFGGVSIQHCSNSVLYFEV